MDNELAKSYKIQRMRRFLVSMGVVGNYYSLNFSISDGNNNLVR